MAPLLPGLVPSSTPSRGHNAPDGAEWGAAALNKLKGRTEREMLRDLSDRSGKLSSSSSTPQARPMSVPKSLSMSALAMASPSGGRGMADRPDSLFPLRPGDRQHDNRGSDDRTSPKSRRQSDVLASTGRRVTDERESASKRQAELLNLSPRANRRSFPGGVPSPTGNRQNRRSLNEVVEASVPELLAPPKIPEVPGLNMSSVQVEMGSPLQTPTADARGNGSARAPASGRAPMSGRAMVSGRAPVSSRAMVSGRAQVSPGVPCSPGRLNRNRSEAVLGRGGLGQQPGARRVITDSRHERALSPSMIGRLERLRSIASTNILSLEASHDAMMNGMSPHRKSLAQASRDRMGLASPAPIDIPLEEVTPPQSRVGTPTQGSRPASRAAISRNSLDGVSTQKLQGVIKKWRRRGSERNLGGQGEKDVKLFDSEAMDGDQEDGSTAEPKHSSEEEAESGEGAGTPEEEADSGSVIHVEFAPTFENMFLWYQDDSQDLKEQARMHIVFKRYSPQGTSDVPRARLPDALQNLGFWGCSAEMVDEFANKVSEYSSFDWVDFGDVVYKLHHHVREEAAKNAMRIVDEEDVRSTDRLERFLRPHGILVGHAGLQLALKHAGKELDDVADSTDLLRLLAGCRVNEGFSPEEVKSAREIFDGLEKHKRDMNNILASELSSGLLDFEGLHCVDDLATLMKSFPCTDDSSPGVSFWEFLVWARRLRQIHLDALCRHFQEADPKDTGFISAEAAVDIAKKLGYTLLRKVAVDIMEENCEVNGGCLNWNSALEFVKAIHASYGFRPTESEEYSSVFKKFDYEETGELTAHQVLDLLRYLGYKTRADQVHSLIRRVDFNQNGTMDVNEFLMLMRLMRETYISQVWDSFEKECGTAQKMPKRGIASTLAKLGERPPADQLQELLDGVPDEVDFEYFAQLADRFRERSTVESRKRANFADDIFHHLQVIFKGHNPDKELLSMGELLWNLSESPVPVNTAAGRAEILNHVEVARKAVLEAGIPAEEAGVAGESVGFYTFVHLMRRLVGDCEQKAIKREQDAIKGAKLSKDETGEFRRLFTSLLDEYGDGTKCGAKKRRRPARTVGGLLEKILSAPVVPEQALLFMLKTLGLRMSAQQLVDLTSKIQECNSGGTEGWIDFVCFVEVMRWMLDVNHAGINCKAGSIVSSSGKASH